MTYHDLPRLRGSLDPRYAHLPAEDLDQLVRQVYGPGVSAEDVEGLFDDIGRGLKGVAQGVGGFARQAAPVLQKALPNIASGAAAGSAFGPWGALIGAAAGAASGILSQSKDPTARGIGGAIHDTGSLVSTVRGGGATGALGALASVGSGALGTTPGGRQAAAQLRGAAGAPEPAPTAGGANALAGLLGRPELFQALTASMMAGFGRGGTKVAGQDIPVSQMLAALSTLAQRAAHEAAALDPGSERTPAFAEAAEATLGLDPEDAEGRTDALLTLLALSPSIWMQRPPVTVQVAPADPLLMAGTEGGWSVGEDWEGDPVSGWEWDEDAGVEAYHA